MAAKRLIDVTDDNIKAILQKVPYYPDEIWKFTAMTNRFPTVDAEEVLHGRWVEKDDAVMHCSLCNRAGNPHIDNYCPKCGARMDGDSQ